mgnify:CR=1 FL=1
MVDIPLAQLVHARIALQVEEVHLEVAMVSTTRLTTAPYVSLENIQILLGQHAYYVVLVNSQIRLGVVQKLIAKIVKRDTILI